MDPLGDVLLAVHEDLGDDFFCMICTNMTYMCHILSHLALKNYFLAVLEKSLSWVMVVTLILESLESADITALDADDFTDVTLAKVTLLM